MKATELQIGDLVKIKGHLDYDKVQEIARDENMQWYISFACSATLFRAYEFEPVPLTPEILEKNGFYDRNTKWYYKRFGSYVCFDIAISLVYKEIEVSKVCGAGTDCEEEEYGSSIVFGNDICVHTLQHALRLCGLDELADNFKVQL